MARCATVIKRKTTWIFVAVFLLSGAPVSATGARFTWIPKFRRRLHGGDPLPTDRAFDKANPCGAYPAAHGCSSEARAHGPAPSEHESSIRDIRTDTPQTRPFILPMVWPKNWRPFFRLSARGPE